METPRPHDPTAFEELVRALYGLAGIRRDLRRRAGIEHVTVGLTALGAIHRIGPARVSDVAAELQVDLSVASRQVQALESEGLVGRVPDPSDRRSRLVAVSEAGDAKLARVHQRLAGALHEALVDWDPETLDALIDSLLRLRSDLGACSPPSPEPGDASVVPAPGP